jgi:hypothetical protein
MVTGSVLRSGQLLLEIPQPESHMDALVENASKPWVPLQEKDPLQAGAGSTDSDGHSRRSASNDDDIVMTIIQHKEPNWSTGKLDYWSIGMLEYRGIELRTHGAGF